MKYSEQKNQFNVDKILGKADVGGAESGDESTPSQGVDRCGSNREDVNNTNQKKQTWEFKEQWGLHGAEVQLSF